MAKNVIKKDRTTTVEATEDSTSWVIDKKATLTGGPGFQAIDLDGVSVDLKGKIITDDEGILVYHVADGATSDDASVTIAKSGRINANLHGIYLEGTRLSLDNAGVVSSGEDFGIQIRGHDAEISNSGKILSNAEDAVRLSDATFFELNNSGVIATKTSAAAIHGTDDTSGSIINEAGGRIGVIRFDLEVGDISITNKGAIAQGLGPMYQGIVFGNGDDSLINRGTIGGDINFWGGDDSADLRKGKTGDVIIYGGTGNDTFIIDNDTAHIYEFNGGGNDTIKTTVSFTLGNTIADRIETLSAIGKKNVDLTGNDEDNKLFGNDKSNHLIGADGDDLLSGEGGNDIMDGGDGDDHFAFGEASGVDTIEGFDIGEDMILLNLIPGIKNFDDLDGKITMSVDDAYAIINLGHGNRIRLAGIDADDLHSSDFSIIGGIDLP